MGRNARSVGERIEQLLAGLRPGRDKEAAEELVRLLVELYGDGLRRVLELVHEQDPNLVHRLVEDELVESLMLVHDLHPVDVEARVKQALDKVRPYLGSHAGGVDYLGIDQDGVVHLRLQGNCDGCPSSTLTVRMAIEGAIQDAAPEIAGIDVAGMTEPEPVAPLLQVGMGPPPGWNAPAGLAVDRSEWTDLPAFGPPTEKPVSLTVEGTPIVVCAVRGELYAYRDACAHCGLSLASAAVNGNVLACPACGARFNVRLAGRGLDASGDHLDPLPLLSDSKGVRVAVPKAVPS